ncbi:WD domain, G-beta repeat protein [Necator americanus]|uniref:methylated diphthine methylhydrolase n=1 Tax=Necator americanus TaxID=51031 RepID=W2TP15_NECAM|nr:WD domain, G-beta repeat protein [Necator americanus]ETN83820.1 WD domain, G-beta repeat protein [Necator americanus]
MLFSLKLNQRPAFARSTNSNILVSTYQLEEPDSRKGSIYLLSNTLDIIHHIDAPAGVFRFDFLKPNVVIAAVTNGSLFTTTFDDSPSTASIHVSDEMLLDVSSPSLTSYVSCTDKAGYAHMIDVDTETVISTWKAHSLPYTDTGCEVWTCSLNDTLLCTGGEDGVLKVWDIRSQTMVQRLNEFNAGVTFSNWKKDNVIITGSYDQHIRLFDMRKSKESLKAIETSGGVWHIEDYQNARQQYRVAACMYGGWTLLDENFDIIKADDKAGQELLYGVTMANENLLIYTTFNYYKVTAVTV